MQLAGASVLRNVGLCTVEKSPRLMREPLGCVPGEPRDQPRVLSVIASLRGGIGLDSVEYRTAKA